MSNLRIYERTPGWPKPEPGTPCAECGASLHGFPCIHHNDSCSYFKEGDLWAESEAVSTMSNLDELDELERGEALAGDTMHTSTVPPRRSELAAARKALADAALEPDLDPSHPLIDGFCPICNGSCLVGFGNRPADDFATADVNEEAKHE